MSEKTRKIMIDIETMGVNNCAALLSIGAVDFDFDRPFVTFDDVTFQAFVDLQSSVDAGGIMDVSTVQWWCDQSRNGSYPFDAESYDFEDEAEALANFHFHIEGVVSTKKEIWVNGANFDPVILENAFKRHGLSIPWKHWEIRDMRTIVKMVDPDKTMKSGETVHGALYDAIDQANWLIKCVQKIKGALGE